MSKRISGERLKPKTDLLPADLDPLEVESFGPPCARVLRKTGWRDLAAAFVGLTLGPDNRRVLLTNFFLIGRLHEDETQVTSLKASKFWPKIADSIELRIPFNDLGVFTFDGGLQSALVASEALDHEFYDTEKDVTVPDDEFVKLGGGGFTMRAFAQMTTSSWCRVTFALLPISKDILVDSFPYCLNTLFPWMKAEIKEIAILPNADKLYGLPFYPLIHKGRREEAFPVFPTFEWREKVAMLLQTAVSPRLVPDGLKLLTKLKKLKDLGEGAEGSLVPGSNPAKPWPAALPSPVLEEDSSVSDGKRKFSFCFVASIISSLATESKNFNSENTDLNATKIGISLNL